MSEVGKWASGQVWILYRNKKIAAKQKKLRKYLHN